MPAGRPACSLKGYTTNRLQQMTNSVAAVIVGLMWIVALQAEVPSAIAIKDAHVVTVSGPELQKGTVLLRDGLIEDVGANLTIPADAWVIDGSGLTVYPGFI